MEARDSLSTEAIPFELAGGSVVGRDHRVIPRNNQDAWHVLAHEDAIVAVVCDGCGSGGFSEVGARLGARLICESVLREVAAHGSEWHWSWVERNVLSSLHTLATAMGGSYRKNVEDYFLFSVTGVVLHWMGKATFFECGDGVVVANGNVIAAEAWADNAPPYLAYQLLDERVRGFAASELHIRTVVEYPFDRLGHFLIGCDGAGRPGLLSVCEGSYNYPGSTEVIKGIRQFWEDDVIFSNPAALSRRLKLIARDWPPRDPRHGLLPDDTTIVVGRRTR